MASPKIEHRKAQGKCLRCKGKAPIGQAVCFDCTDTMAAAKQAAREQGLCLDCWKASVVPGRRCCRGCLAHRSWATARRKVIRKQQGLCVKCGQAPGYHGRLLCAYCWGKSYGLS